MKRDRLHYLIHQYVNNKCTTEELRELLRFVKQDKDRQGLRQELKTWWNDASADEDNALQWDLHFEIMMNEAKAETDLWNKANQPRKKLKIETAVAFLLLLIGSVGAYQWFIHDRQPTEQPTLTHEATNEYKNDIPPGGPKATLTLANGTDIILNNAQSGSLATQGNSTISKAGDGRLVYRTALNNSKETIYNTITTPRGGQYEITLADGSKVWLNAASSLKFPASFPGKEREVSLKGEAYFEIATNSHKPFIVKINHTRIEVLGTHFEVSAYNTRNIKTTLLQGAVKMQYHDISAILKPGQQAVLNSKKEHISVSKADMEEAVAWKNGFFQFNNSSLDTIMQQIARWYNVEISYKGGIPERRFTGKMSRNVSLKHVLKVLELSDVKFQLDGRKITVLQ